VAAKRVQSQFFGTINISPAALTFHSSKQVDEVVLIWWPNYASGICPHHHTHIFLLWGHPKFWLFASARLKFMILSISKK
jgi:hypothetical protein